MLLKLIIVGDLNKDLLNPNHHELKKHIIDKFLAQYH